MEEWKTNPQVHQQILQTWDQLAAIQSKPLVTIKQLSSNIPQHLMLKGILAKQWQMNQEITQDQPLPRDNSRWSSKMSTLLTTVMREAWTQRNDKVFCSTFNPNYHPSREITRARITNLYSFQTQMSDRDNRKFFYKPLHKKLEENHHQLLEWIKITTQSIHQAVHNHNTTNATSHHAIRGFFNPKHNPPDTLHESDHTTE